jgi:hypothetical protein
MVKYRVFLASGLYVAEGGYTALAEEALLFDDRSTGVAAINRLEPGHVRPYEIQPVQLPSEPRPFRLLRHNTLIGLEGACGTQIWMDGQDFEDITGISLVDGGVGRWYKLTETMINTRWMARD